MYVKGALRACREVGLGARTVSIFAERIFREPKGFFLFCFISLYFHDLGRSSRSGGFLGGVWTVSRPLRTLFTLYFERVLKGFF